MLALSAMLISASAATADIRPILQAQGFDRPLNGRETIRYAGHIRQGRNDYQIYTYFGVFKAAVIDHASSDVIVILNGSSYVGEYHVAMPTRCKVRGNKVICRTEDSLMGGRPDVIEFTKRGPPRKIWFDGEILEIEVGDLLKKRARQEGAR